MPYLKIVSYTLSTMQSITESKFSGHPKLRRTVGELPYLECFSIDVGRLWQSYKAQEEMLAQIFWGRDFQEEVHKDLEADKIDFLWEKQQKSRDEMKLAY